MLWFFFGSRGRLDRRSYFAAVICLMALAVILTGLAKWEGEFTSGGALLDDLWNARYAEYGRKLDEIAARRPGSLVAVLMVHGLVAFSFLSLSARRLQDMGRPGVYAALAFVTGPMLLAVVIAVLPGDKSENAYGSRRARDRRSPKTGSIQTRVAP